MQCDREQLFIYLFFIYLFFSKAGRCRSANEIAAENRGRKDSAKLLFMLIVSKCMEAGR